MPVVGLGLGVPLAHAIGGVADYLVGVGLWKLLGGDEDAEEDKARRLVDARGLAVLGLGLAISLESCDRVQPGLDPVSAENLVRAGQAAYSWRSPAR